MDVKVRFTRGPVDKNSAHHPQMAVYHDCHGHLRRGPEQRAPSPATSVVVRKTSRYKMVDVFTFQPLIFPPANIHQDKELISRFMSTPCANCN